ncbi:MAG TPA: response regulator transcription factor [Clostridiaceae bacterium]
MYKVLIVDDEPFVRDGLKLIIDWEQYGFYICGEASDGDEGLKLMEDKSPDLVITDIKMPEMDGFEFIEQSKKNLGLNTHFIILSGYSDFEYAQRAIRYGVINYLLKPIEEDELIGVLQKISKELIAKELEDKLGESNNNNVIKSLIYDNFELFPLKYLEEFFKNIKNLKKRYVQVEISILEWFEKLEEDELQSNLEKIREIIHKAINKENINCLYDEELGKYGIILSENILKHFNNDIEIFVNSLFNDIKNILNCSCLIIVGKEIMKLSDLKESYKSCIEGKHFNLFYQNSIIFYDKVKQIEFNYSLSDDISVEKLIDAIEKEDTKRIINDINEILNNIRNKQVPPEIIYTYFIIFISKVITCIYKKYGDVDEFMKNYTNLNQLQGSSMDEMQETLVSFSFDISKYINSLKNNRQPTSMYEVEKYINNNYQYDITLKKLSDVFFINPVYLGQLLKKNLGMYFNDYLQHVRIEEAKKILRRSNLKTCEIANQVGYSDPNYFFNKFEKVTHITPTQYRNSK